MTRLGLAAYRASFLLAPLTALSLVQGTHWALADPSGRAWATWWPIVVIYGIVPALDLLLGPLPTRLTDEERRRLARDPWLRAVPWLCGLTWLALLSWAFLLLPALVDRLPAIGVVGFAVSLGVIGGILAINTGHELVHRANPLERAFGGLLLASVCYGVFKVEHVLGHHLNVATAADPATARRGESAWRFVPRAILGVWRHGWRLAAERSARRGRRGLAALLGNEVLHWSVVSAVFAGLAVVLSGLTVLALAVFVVMSLIAIIELELVDYVEHYGLERRIDGERRLEPVGYVHSWDYAGWLTNGFLLNLQRHSDHHVHGGRPFGALESRPGAPQLPANYAVMLMSALVPPLWRTLIHPRLDRVTEQS